MRIGTVRIVSSVFLAMFHSAHNTRLRLHSHVSAPPDEPDTVTVLVTLVFIPLSRFPHSFRAEFRTSTADCICLALPWPPLSRRCVCVSEKWPAKTRISSTAFCAARTGSRATERLVLAISQSLDAGMRIYSFIGVTFFVVVSVLNE
jgi:hypothetical protein